MGRFVSVHPLGVIVAIGCGVLVAGIAGALIAVPLAAAGNAVVNHLDARAGSPRTTNHRSMIRRTRRTTWSKWRKRCLVTDPRLTSVTLADVEAAREVLEGVTLRTPMEGARWLSALVDGPVSLKCENLQRTGSFKIRGAYVRMSRLSPEERAAGVVAASAGNHAQGVALAASPRDRSTVFMPEGARSPRRRRPGRTAPTCGSTAATSRTHWSRRGGSPRRRCGADPSVRPRRRRRRAGHGRPGDPRAGARREDRDRADRWRRAARRDRHRDQGVAPRRPRDRGAGRGGRGVPGVAATGRPVALASMATMADGIAVGCPGEITFAVVRDHCDEVRTVSEESLSRALLALVERAKMVVEPAGAAAVAAILDTPTALRAPVVAVLSGGNVDPLLLGKVIRHGLAAAGRYLYLRVGIPDRRAAWPVCSPVSARRAPTCSRSPTSGSRRPSTSTRSRCGSSWRPAARRTRRP